MVQLLGAMIVLFVAVMAVIGSQGNFPISFGTPGLVRNFSSYKKFGKVKAYNI